MAAPFARLRTPVREVCPEPPARCLARWGLSRRREGGEEGGEGEGEGGEQRGDRQGEQTGQPQHWQIHPHQASPDGEGELFLHLLSPIPFGVAVTAVEVSRWDGSGDGERRTERARRRAR